MSTKLLRIKAGIYHPKDEFEFNTTNVIKEIRKTKIKARFYYQFQNDLSLIK